MIFRGINVEASKKRISDKDRDPKKYYYNARHIDENWGVPYILEKQPVLVNYCGVLIADKPLFEGESSNLDSYEMLIVAKMLGEEYELFCETCDEYIDFTEYTVENGKYYTVCQKCKHKNEMWEHEDIDNE